MADNSTGRVDNQQRVEGLLVMYCGDEIARRLITEWIRTGLSATEMEERALRLIIDVTGLKVSI